MSISPSAVVDDDLHKSANGDHHKNESSSNPNIIGDVKPSDDPEEDVEESESDFGCTIHEQWTARKTATKLIIEKRGDPNGACLQFNLHRTLKNCVKWRCYRCHIVKSAVGTGVTEIRIPSIATTGQAFNRKLVDDPFNPPNAMHTCRPDVFVDVMELQEERKIRSTLSKTELMSRSRKQVRSGDFRFCQGPHKKRRRSKADVGEVVDSKKIRTVSRKKGRNRKQPESSDTESGSEDYLDNPQLQALYGANQYFDFDDPSGMLSGVSMQPVGNFPVSDLTVGTSYLQVGYVHMYEV